MRLHISFPIVLWYQHSWENEIKKSRIPTCGRAVTVRTMALTRHRTSCVVSFVHKPGCAFVYQLLDTYLQLPAASISGRRLRLCPGGLLALVRPTVPVTTLLIEPKQLFRPMFQFPGYAPLSDVELLTAFSTLAQSRFDPRSFHTFKLAWRHAQILRA